MILTEKDGAYAGAMRTPLSPSAGVNTMATRPPPRMPGVSERSLPVVLLGGEAVEGQVRVAEGGGCIEGAGDVAGGSGVCNGWDGAVAPSRGMFR